MTIDWTIELSSTILISCVQSNAWLVSYGDMSTVKGEVCGKGSFVGNVIVTTCN